MRGIPEDVINIIPRLILHFSHYIQFTFVLIAHLSNIRDYTSSIFCLLALSHLIAVCIDPRPPGIHYDVGVCMLYFLVQI